MSSLNLEPWDYMGPMGYNDELAEKIKKEGKKIDVSELKVDEKYPEYSVSLMVLHLPSNKVNNYEIYGDYATKKLRAFDGFGMPTVDEPMDNFMYLYHDETRVGSDSSFHPNDKYLDDALKKARSEKVELKEIMKILENEWNDKHISKGAA